MQQAILPVLQENRALGRVGVDKVGAAAPKRTASFKREAGLCHDEGPARMMVNGEWWRLQSVLYGTRHLRDRALRTRRVQTLAWALKPLGTLNLA